MFLVGSYNQVVFSLLITYVLVTIRYNLKTLFPGGASGKEPICQCRRHEMQVQSLGWEDPMEESMATHSSILAWIIPWTEEPGRLHLVHRVAKSWTSLK